MGKINPNFPRCEIDTFVKCYRASGLSFRKFAGAVDISERSLRRWNRNKLEGKPYKPSKHKPQRAYSHVETMLNEYALTEYSCGRYVTNADLKEKALKFAGLEGVQSGFTASDGWITRFKERMVLTYRAPTHTARKVEFTVEDLDAEETFFVELEGHLQADQVPNYCVYNFDQTMIRLVSPHPKTIPPRVRSRWL